MIITEAERQRCRQRAEEYGYSHKAVQYIDSAHHLVGFPPLYFQLAYSEEWRVVLVLCKNNHHRSVCMASALDAWGSLRVSVPIIRYAFVVNKHGQWEGTYFLFVVPTDTERIFGSHSSAWAVAHPGYSWLRPWLFPNAKARRR